MVNQTFPWISLIHLHKGCRITDTGRAEELQPAWGFYPSQEAPHCYVNVKSMDSWSTSLEWCCSNHTLSFTWSFRWFGAIFDVLSISHIYQIRATQAIFIPSIKKVLFFPVWSGSRVELEKPQQFSSRATLELDKLHWKLLYN